MSPRPLRTTPSPYTTLFRSSRMAINLGRRVRKAEGGTTVIPTDGAWDTLDPGGAIRHFRWADRIRDPILSTLGRPVHARSEEHTSELQSRPHFVCRLLLEKY